jgi:predicted transposase YbfD/YdcC
VVSIDAAGCQRTIAVEIIDKGADYLLAVKENRPTLYAQVTEAFDGALHGGAHLELLDEHETHDKAHGRTETRRCFTMPVPESVTCASKWSGLETLVLVEDERQVGNEEAKDELWLFISSQSGLSARDALASVRGHWGIENRLHWVLDVAYREDDCRVRAGNAADNFAVMRHISVNLLQKATRAKVGIENWRLKCAWNNDVLLDVLTGRAGK